MRASPAAESFAPLLSRVDTTRIEAVHQLDAAERGKKGQFLTPSHVATLMASMFNDVLPDRVRLLDAGAGIGTLTAAFIMECVHRERRPTEIVVAAYEIENALLPGLSKTLEMCRQTCAEAGIHFRAEVRHEDFVDAAVQGLEPTLFRHESASDFNCAILNPPYRKIQSNSKTRRLLRRVGIETSNLYSAFVSLVIKLLGPAGQLVAITPRSFCNGPYFRPFRELLLDNTALKRIHVFESRKTAFSDDDVLQENVIFHAVKGRQCNRIIVSSSVGPSDETKSRSLRYEKVVRPNDRERFIRLSISAQDERATTMMGSLEATLSERHFSGHAPTEPVTAKERAQIVLAQSLLESAGGLMQASADRSRDFKKINRRLESAADWKSTAKDYLDYLIKVPKISANYIAIAAMLDNVMQKIRENTERLAESANVAAVKRYTSDTETTNEVIRNARVAVQLVLDRPTVENKKLAHSATEKLISALEPRAKIEKTFAETATDVPGLRPIQTEELEKKLREALSPRTVVTPMYTPRFLDVP